MTLWNKKKPVTTDIMSINTIKLSMQLASQWQALFIHNGVGTQVFADIDCQLRLASLAVFLNLSIINEVHSNSYPRIERGVRGTYCNWITESLLEGGELGDFNPGKYVNDHLKVYNLLKANSGSSDDYAWNLASYVFRNEQLAERTSHIFEGIVSSHKNTYRAEYKKFKLKEPQTNEEKAIRDMVSGFERMLEEAN